MMHLVKRYVKKEVWDPTRNYTLIAGLLVLSWLLATVSDSLLSHGFFSHNEQGATLAVLAEIIIVSVFGFLAYELAKPTVIPSFVLAIFVGMMQHDNLSVLVNNPVTLTALTTLGAIFILFGGGLDTPFARFRALLLPILSIAFIGTVITALLFSFALTSVSGFMGVAIPLGAVILVGAALASTDPAAIIPSFKSLHFINPRVKYVAVSESALNDVVGAVLTGVFLTIIAAHPDVTSLLSTYGKLLTAETGLTVMHELVVGCAIGFCGFLILRQWSAWKEKSNAGGEADAALFLAVPLLCYAIATVLGGNGFLAVFISSLLFHLKEHVSHVEHYFNHTIEGFMKPMIFMLLGAAVQVKDLTGVAGLGIAMGLLFMLVIRPIVVFLTLAPFMRGTHKLTVKELLFLSFVRETGVIPAVLLIGLKVSGIPGAETVVAIGLWVILLTLIVQPPLTPFVAKWLGIASTQAPETASAHTGPIAVLCSRGNSFEHRLGIVTDWAIGHHVSHVTVLHCPEDHYSADYIAQMRVKADILFAAQRERCTKAGKTPPAFEFIGKQGLLQDNIESLVHESDVSIVFVGNKMLDYRMEEIKHLQVPFVFVE